MVKQISNYLYGLLSHFVWFTDTHLYGLLSQPDPHSDISDWINCVNAHFQNIETLKYSFFSIVRVGELQIINGMISNDRSKEQICLCGLLSHSVCSGLSNLFSKNRSRKLIF